MITPVSPKMYNLNFGSNSIVKTNGKFGNQRTLVNINGNEYEYNHNQHVSNYTFFFRDILAAPFDKNHKGWERLFDVILKNLPKDEKINFYDIACSDGSEAYSVIMTLNERLGEEEAKRFYPIHATDCDGNIIQNAKKYVFASKSDIDNIRYYTSENLDTYFKKQKAEGDEYNYGYKLKPKNIGRTGYSN